MSTEIAYRLALKRYLELQAQWQALGFWQRIWQSRSFKVRFEVVLQVMELYNPNKVKKL